MGSPLAGAGTKCYQRTEGAPCLGKGNRCYTKSGLCQQWPPTDTLQGWPRLGTSTRSGWACLPLWCLGFGWYWWAQLGSLAFYCGPGDSGSLQGQSDQLFSIYCSSFSWAWACGSNKAGRRTGGTWGHCHFHMTGYCAVPYTYIGRTRIASWGAASNPGLAGAGG